MGPLPAGGGTRVLTIQARHGFAGKFPAATVTSSLSDDVSWNNLSGVETLAGDPGDQDQDGMPDWWETENGLSQWDATHDNGARGDLDKDGLSNWEEFVAYTKANDPDSYSKMDYRRSSADRLILEIETSRFRLYQVHYGNSIGTESWIRDSTKGDGSLWESDLYMDPENEIGIFHLEVLLP